MDWLRRQFKIDARRFLYSRRSETAASTLLAIASVCLCFFALFLLEYLCGLTDASSLLTLPSVPAELWATGEALRRPEAYVLAAGVAMALLLVSPLRVGRARWYLENSRGNALPAAMPFCGLRTYLRALYVSLYDVLLRLISVLPVMGLIWFGHLGIQAGAAYLGWTELTRRLMLLVLWLIAAFLIMLWLWFIQRWALLPYLAFERRGLGLGALVRLSRRATRGWRFELLYARLSFVGWGLLSVLLLPVLYVFPYYEQTMALYARYLIEHADAEPESAPGTHGTSDVPAGPALEQDTPAGPALEQDTHAPDAPDAPELPVDSEPAPSEDASPDGEPIPVPEQDAPASPEQQADSEPDADSAPAPSDPADPDSASDADGESPSQA